MDKAQLRRQLMDCLLAISPEQRNEKSRKACHNLVSTAHFQEASTVMMFVSLPHEVDTSEVILHAWQLGKIVAVPKISWQQRHMIAVQINSLETGFSTSASGLRNPISGVPVPFGEIDLVVAPMLAIDGKGNRLGRGGAYYDKFFAHPELKAVKCGFGFAEQLLDSVPTADHDQSVDMLVTDEQITYFDHRKGE
ncbi:MAG: 5-formyltetrahydrofolate cyclo-ligase [Planctomycetota bacterium]|jgi:5-formyltetrahydrofolate cyclo-ligase